MDWTILHLTEDFNLSFEMFTWFVKSKDCSGCEYFSPDLLECRDDVSSHSNYYQLSSEILKYKLILFHSDHSNLEIEKQNRFD